MPFGTAVCALVGLGVVRDLPPTHVALVGALLPSLPIAGFWAMGGRKPWAAVVGLWTWSGLLLAGLPGYFPGEVPGAIASGMAVLAAPGGLDASREAARLGSRLAEPVAAAREGVAPAPEAERPTPVCPPAAAAATGDQVALPYEGQGHSLAIPVQFGEVELQMLFDTGATVTTLSRADLRRIGIPVPADAPEITLRTANGERTARLVMVPKVWVGGLPVVGVTVGVCEECADAHTAGLLGLNVSGQFLVTLDTARKEVVFQVRDSDPDRVVDIAPWMSVRATATVFPDERVEVVVDADNRADRAVSEARVGIHCGGEDFLVRVNDIPARGHGNGRVSLPRGTSCEAYTVSLDGARW